MTIKARPTGNNELYVYWEGGDAERYELRRSTSPEGPYEIIASSLPVPFFVDQDVNLHDPAVRYYYKTVGFTGGVQVLQDETAPASPIHFPKDRVSNAVIYESRKVLKVMNNPKVFVLLKRRVGKPCPDCWNPVTKKVRYANCSTCNGTGKIEGYYPPIPMRISHDVSNLMNDSSMLDGDSARKTPIKAWISNRPLLSPGDIIVDVQNQRFSVQSVVPRTKSSYVHRQILQLFPLDKGHPAYSVDVSFQTSSLVDS